VGKVHPQRLWGARRACATVRAMSTPATTPAAGSDVVLSYQLRGGPDAQRVEAAIEHAAKRAGFAEVP
jgi:hypothetical protein